MTGNKGFSVDDILNEIGSSDNRAKNTVNDDFDIDEILNFKPNKTTAPSNISDQAQSVNVKSRKANKPQPRGKIDEEPNKRLKNAPLKLAAVFLLTMLGKFLPKSTRK